MYEIQIKIEENEYWYGLSVDDGTLFPLCKESLFAKDYRVNQTENQINPVLVSSQGRYIWCEQGYAVDVAEGVMKLTSVEEEILLKEGYGSLREAYLAAAQTHFLSNGVIPPDDFFCKPQYNTWIELVYDQNQEDVLKYARAIVEQGYPTGILMIDDGWSEYYGKWVFHPGRFPDPKKMVAELHEMGFVVMLWTAPFISPDSPEFRNLEQRGCLVKNQNGSTAIREWWNGHSAVLDLTNPETVAWYRSQNEQLQESYGIDGFKFDAGDGKYYRDNDKTYANATANDQNMLWALHAGEYEYNELRSCFKAAGQPLVQRLADRRHSWDAMGMGALLPNGLTQGISGYAYTCPDMIGGGSYTCFLKDSFTLDEELFVRYAQCAALMPMMQFSAAPWRVLSQENNRICHKMAKLHETYAPEILQLAKQAAKTGEPIVRYMEYQFPHQGMADIKSQFMLGDKILVAPVCEKGATQKKVTLPQGKWTYVDGTVWEGGKEICVDAPLEVLPYFVCAE